MSETNNSRLVNTPDAQPEPAMAFQTILALGAPGIKVVPALPAFKHSTTSFTERQVLAATTSDVEKAFGSRGAFFEQLGSVP